MWFRGQQPKPQWWPQPQLLQPLLQPQFEAQPQLGAAAAHDASQAGAAALQVFSQHVGWQQLLQPQESVPNMRSSRVAP